MSVEAAEPITPSGYIVHHLTHLQNKPADGLVDFTTFDLDSIFFFVLIGVLGCFAMWLAARKVTSGVPGRFQAAVEFLVEMVNNESKTSFTTKKAASW